MNALWILVKPEEASGSKEAEEKLLRVGNYLKSADPEQDEYGGWSRWKISDKFASKAIYDDLKQFLSLAEFQILKE